MSLTAFFFPPLPVVIGLAIAIPILLLVAFFSQKVTANLNEKQEASSAAETILYAVRTVCETLTVVLAGYLFFAGMNLGVMNASDGFCHVAGQIGRVLLILLFVAALVLSVLGASMSRRLWTIEKNATERDSLENNREYKALQALDKALPPVEARVGATLALIPLFIAIVAAF
jgi:hypothetical protein